MGKHSKPRTPRLAGALTGKRAPVVGVALIPVVGAFAAAAGADHLSPTSAPPVVAESHESPAVPHRSAVTPMPAAQAAQEAKTEPGDSVSAVSAPHFGLATAAPKAATQAPPPPPLLPASVTDGVVPKVAFEAYRQAADTISRAQPKCGIPWTLIAGVGRVESHHANQGDARADGSLIDPIYGPTLDGTLAGNQVITDTDGGRLDGDAVHDRAVGPMQFIPATWEKYAADGNGDGKADPQNLFDAALTTARYLCDGLDLRNPAGQATAVLRYNNSMAYVNEVLGFARSY